MQPSVTSSDSFQIRAQRSEQHRIIIMLGVLAAILAIMVTRRILGDQLISDRLFVVGVSIIAAIALYEFVMLHNARRANRESRLLPRWRWTVNAIVETAGPLVLLVMFRYLSPRGETLALTGPVLLVIPIILLLSVLRLRPKLTLWSGVTAGLTHAILVLHAAFDTNPQHYTTAVLLTYSFLLALTGVAGGVVAHHVKQYVKDAAEESAAREQARNRVEVMQRDLSIAREIQRGLLPSAPPRLADFDIAGLNQPAEETGGDYYDWQTLPDGRVIIALADVTGHGVGPALIMAVCRAYARASSTVVPLVSPFVGRLNNLIHEDVRGTRFITFAAALIDPGKRTVELLSAGHGPILYYRAAGGTIEQFVGDGFPLGIVPDESYPPGRVINMQPGDILLLLTDGFFEWQRSGDGEAVGIERIERLLKDHASQPAASLLYEIDAAVRNFVDGAAQTDDMTAVAIKRI